MLGDGDALTTTGGKLFPNVAGEWECEGSEGADKVDVITCVNFITRSSQPGGIFFG